MEFDCLDISDCVEFNWDNGNITKNELKHKLKWNVIEEVFFNEPLLLLKDKKHSIDECRCIAFGHNNSMQLLTVIFVKRNNKIRVISARAMSKRERIYYETNT